METKFSVGQIVRITVVLPSDDVTEEESEFLKGKVGTVEEINIMADGTILYGLSSSDNPLIESLLFEEHEIEVL